MIFAITFVKISKMLRILSLIIVLLLGFQLSAQNTHPPSTNIDRPKLVVGIVVDQMRWDFLYRYYSRYQANGGFKRFLIQGFSCENTFIPYIPTYTACGHATVYTGSVPGVHGITGNAWFDRIDNRTVYCTDDLEVKGVGDTGVVGKMSPKNMIVTTICDEMRLATNFRSKVIGVAIKDRGSILPAGHSANGAYWYNSGTGRWITSTFYMQDLPSWVKQFNAKNLTDSYYNKGWNTLYPISTYKQSTSDEKVYEGKPLGSEAKGFPYDLKKFIGKNYGAIASTPYGNTFTIDMAKAAVEGENLGSDADTDFLAVSFSSPDYVGHSFGPNSIEIEDTYLRLDKDLGDFFNYLDSKIGRNKYIAFLSADHAVAHVPGFLNENRIPAGTFNEITTRETLNRILKDKFGGDNLVVSMSNYQVHFNRALIATLKLDMEDLKKLVTDSLLTRQEMSHVVDLKQLGIVPLPAKIKDMIANGYYPSRNGDLQIILRPHWMSGGSTGTTHGSWSPYDAHIPLLWYGWNIKPGKTHRETYMTDIAPTLAALLNIQMPSGTVGHVIPEIIK